MILLLCNLGLGFFSELQTVQQRGAAVIKARKLSSAMSAAKAICDHVRDIWFGTPAVRCCSWVSACLPDGFDYMPVSLTSRMCVQRGKNLSFSGIKCVTGDAVYWKLKFCLLPAVRNVLSLNFLVSGWICFHGSNFWWQFLWCSWRPAVFIPCCDQGN